MKKAVVIVIVLGLLGLLGWQVFAKVKEAQAKKGTDRGRGRGTAAVAVEVAAVRKATIREFGQFTGSLLPRSQFVVAPKIAGRLEKLLVDVGDSVKSGQLIAVLDDAEYAQGVEQARAEQRVAEAAVAECKASVAESASALEFAKSEYKKEKELYAGKIASESERDEARTKSEACEAKYQAAQAKESVALAQVEQRKAALKGAEVRLSYTQIRATWEGNTAPRVVGERFVDAGEMLRANDAIVSILDNGSMTAVINVIERDYPKIGVGQAATITTDPFPGKTFTGKVRRIAPLLKETARQARVEIEIPNEEGPLKRGMFVRAELEFARHEDANVVPVAAVAKRDGREGVFVVESAAAGKTARFVPVKLGIVTNELAEVIDPVLTGSVVTLGQHLLQADGENLVEVGGGAPRGRTDVTTQPAGVGTSTTKEQQR